MTTPQTTPELPDSRAAFEAWYTSRHGQSMLARAANGPYVWDTVNDRWEAWKAALAARVTAAPQEGVSVPPGYALVPIEPTPEMCAAATEQGHYDNRRGTVTVSSNIYRAMVSAAPPPLSPPDTGNVGATLAGAVLSLNTAWNAKEPEDVIAGKLDLCRRLALNADQPAEQRDRGEACPNCNGEGSVLAYSNHGPDSYEMSVDCPHCEGGQTLYLAYHGAVKRIAEAEEKYLKACSIIWGWSNRDQVTVIKHRLMEIAKQIRPDTLDWLRNRLADLAESATEHLAATSAEAADQVPSWLAKKAIKALNETDPEAEITIAVSAWLTEHPEEGAETVHQFKSFTLAALPPPGRGMVPMSDSQIQDWIETIATYDIAGWKLWGSSQITKFARAIEAHHGIKEGS